VGEDRAAAVARLRRDLAADPGDRVAWHNLAAAEGDLGHAAEAEAAARRALALGIAAPETRLVLARALLGQSRLEEAERAFEEALALRPVYAHAHRDLAQLRWMRSGNVRVALRALDEALVKAPGEAALYLVKSIALEFMEDLPSALASAEAGLARAPGDLQLLRQAAHLSATTGEAERAVFLARRAAQSAPADPGVQVALCEALLASGHLEEAEAVAARLCAAEPFDQHALALRATAWRLLGDPRHRAIHDYSALVHAERLPPPRGWPSLEAFLAELAAEFEELHRFKAHPFQQSVRGGSQLPFNAGEFARPSIRALFDAIQEVAQGHLERVGAGTDPFRTRNTGRIAITGAWSVRLASGGHHTDHVHPRGWLSSAFYVAVPPDMGGESRPHAGWLRLGQPGIATATPLPPEHFVRPEPGFLVLFPAYMWHGVERFESASPRLSIAFDAVPA
jgi:tetratricopeptide (TPR) repeat protein